MHQTANPTAAMERSRWLAELALALDQARHLATQLGLARGGSRDIEELCARLDVLRSELEALRRVHRSVPGREVDPRWSNLLPPTRLTHTSGDS